MPQLDTATFAPQLVWLAITFIGLYLILARAVLPRIASVLEERQKRIDVNLEKAEALKVKAEAARAAYEEALDAARVAAHTRLSEAADVLAREAAERHEALAGKLAQEGKEAEERIGAAMEEALKHIHTVAAEIAGAATEKLIGLKIGEQGARAAVETVLGEKD
ncbi:MAG: F0F1 ATP synthase subunit B' [Alphaproteobacteria bacterium]|nr:MAG: F0F1 ATP synthase subunit B' [Alphaproteobacteria bacterium]